MAILNTISLESNKQIQINFNGGKLSSDGGLLLIKEFAVKIGLIKLVNQLFKTNDHSKAVNANRLQVHALAYNLFNWFRRLALSASMRKQRIDTIRLKLLKVAAKVVHSARYNIFNLCSSCPYKQEFYETLSNIRSLQPQLE